MEQVKRTPFWEEQVLQAQKIKTPEPQPPKAQAPKMQAPRPEVGRMIWKRARDPKAPAPPVFHDPLRCMNCGHLASEHSPEVGCLIEGGTKYIENASGKGMHACSCEAYVPSPEVEEVKGEK